MKFTPVFNGAQLVGVNLQRVVEAAGNNTTVSIAAAHLADPSVLESVLSSGKNLTAEFNAVNCLPTYF